MNLFYNICIIDGVGVCRMGTFTDVEIGQLEQAFNNIHQNINNIQSVYNVLNTDVLNKLVPHWQGEAQQLFFQQFTAYLTSLNQLINNYEILNNQLKIGASQYTQANTLVVQNINRMPGR
jgi:WXG100 family type VII secretion target